jgi:hypothetical protein
MAVIAGQNHRTKEHNAAVMISLAANRHLHALSRKAGFGVQWRFFANDAHWQKWPISCMA